MTPSIASVEEVVRELRSIPAMSTYVQINGVIEQACALLSALEKDAARLDWLLSDAARGQAIRVQGSNERGWRVINMADGLVIIGAGPTPRMAIDLARGATGENNGR